MGYWGCEMLRVCVVRYVGCWRCGMLGMWYVQDVGCWGYLGCSAWDIWRDMGC